MYINQIVYSGVVRWGVNIDLFDDRFTLVGGSGGDEPPSSSGPNNGRLRLYTFHEDQESNLVIHQRIVTEFGEIDLTGVKIEQVIYAENADLVSEVYYVQPVGSCNVSFTALENNLVKVEIVLNGAITGLSVDGYNYIELVYGIRKSDYTSMNKEQAPMCQDEYGNYIQPGSDWIQYPNTTIIDVQ